MTIKKATNIFILLTLFVLLLCPIRSEASKASQEKAVKSQVTKYFDGIKKHDYSIIEKTMTDTAKKSIVKHEQPIEKIICKMQKKWFYYKIKSIKVTGNKAAVSVSVGYYDANQDYINAFKDLLDDTRKDLSISKSKSRSYKIFVSHFSDHYKLALSFVPNKKDYDDEDLEPDGYYYQEYDAWKAEYKVYYSFKIQLVKEKGKWKISKHSRNMQDMMDCRVNLARKEISQDADEYKRYFYWGF